MKLPIKRPLQIVRPVQEFQLFLKAEGDLEANPAWTALRPIPSAGIVDGTAKLSKQLLGWERSVIDPVQVWKLPVRNTREKTASTRKVACIKERSPVTLLNLTQCASGLWMAQQSCPSSFWNRGGQCSTRCS
eukprot:scaffold134002_cov22-Tisochrysis_lutea.AAC.1